MPPSYGNEQRVSGREYALVGRRFPETREMPRVHVIDIPNSAGVGEISRKDPVRIQAPQIGPVEQEESLSTRHQRMNDVQGIIVGSRHRVARAHPDALGDDLCCVQECRRGNVFGERVEQIGVMAP